MKRGLHRGVFQEPRDRHRIAQSYSLQFIDGAAGRSDGHNFAARIAQVKVYFMQGGRLACSGCPSQVYSQIARIQNLMNGTPLFLSKALRRAEITLAAQSLEMPDSTINDRNHTLFTIETFAGS